MTSGTKCAVILVATLLLGSASAQLEYAANNASYGWIYGGEEGLDNAQKPENWEMLEIGNCGGDSQSPIDIDTSSLSPSDNLTITSIDSVNFPNLNDSSIKAIKNLGKSVQLDMDDPSSATVTTNDGSVHALLQFHFHWGSEHKVDNERYPMEAHFVLNTSSVIGVLFQSTNSSDEVDSDVDSLIDNISNATNVNNNNPGEDQGGSPSDLNGSELATLLPSDTSFFYYSGSLTTPPCTEGVDWFVMQNTWIISNITIDKFHNKVATNSSGPIKTWRYERGIHYTRPVQDVNNRTVYDSEMTSSSEDSAEDSDGSGASGMASSIVAAVLAVLALGMA